MPKKRTDKHDRFIKEYMVDMNATRAAIRAGYSEKTAYSTGVQLLNKPGVKEKIEAAQKSIAEKLNITTERVLREYARLAFLDIRKAFDADGTLKPIDELDDDTAAAISGIEVESLFEGRGGEREIIGKLHKIKLSDKKGALDSLAKHLGIFSDGSLSVVVNNHLAEEDKKTLDDYTKAK
jgi:phage terminase small subunit